MKSVPWRWSVSCWKMRARNPSASNSTGRPCEVLGAQVQARRALRRRVRAPDGQASLVHDVLPLETGELGVGERVRAGLVAGVEDDEPDRTPDLGGRQADARRVVHRLDHVGGERARARRRTARRSRRAAAGRGRRAVGSDGSSRCVASSVAWEGPCPPGTKTTDAARPRPWRRRPGSASCRTARPNAGTSPGPTVTRHTVLLPEPGRRAACMGPSAGERRLQLGGPRHAEHRGAPPGTRPRRASARRPGGTAPGCRPRAPGPAGRSACSTGPRRGRRGRAHAAASIHSARERSPAARPGRRAARSASRMPTRSSPGGGTSFTASGPPTRIPRSPSAGRGSGSAPGRAPDRHSGDPAGPLLDALGAAAGEPEHPAAAVRAPAGRLAAPRTGPRPPPAGAVPPHAAHRAGLAAGPAHAGDAVAGQRRVQERPPRALHQGPTRRGARPSGPGRTTSTGGQARPAGATLRGPGRAAASPVGHSDAHHAHARPRSPPGPRPRRGRGRPATAPPGAPGCDSREIQISPRSGTGANTAAPRPHDDPVPPGPHRQPHPVPHRARIPPGTRPRRRRTPPAPPPAGGGHRSASGTTTTAVRPAASARRDRLDRERLFVLRAPDARRTRPAEPDSTAAGRAAGPFRYRSNSPPSARPTASRRRARAGIAASAPSSSEPRGRRQPGRDRSRAARRSARPSTAPAPASARRRTGPATRAFFTASIRAGTSSVGPSTQPRVGLPWNGTWTSDPTPAPSDPSSE